jgi:hypothetical protein
MIIIECFFNNWPILVSCIHCIGHTKISLVCVNCDTCTLTLVGILSRSNNENWDERKSNKSFLDYFDFWVDLGNL